MKSGITINIIGTGLLTSIDADTSTVKWASYMIINGIGIGMAMQLPALQVVLEYVFTFSFILWCLICSQADRCAYWEWY